MSDSEAIPSRIESIEENRDKNILDTLSSLQDEINVLRTEKKDYLNQLNQFRLGLYIPKLTDPLDVNPIAHRVTFSIGEIMKDGGIEAGQLYHRLFLELAARTSDAVDDLRSKIGVKIRLEDKDKEAKKNVERLRESSSPEAKKKKIQLTTAEKAVNGLRKMAQKGNVKLTVSQLVPFISALMQGSMTEEDIRSHLESIFAKEAQAKA